MKPRREAKDLMREESGGSGVSRPVVVAVPDGGVAFAESVHAQDFAMSPRVDAFHKLVYVLRGRVRYEEEGRTAEAAEVGAVIVVPQRRRHVLVDEVASTLLLLGVSDGFLAGDEDVAEMWRALSARARRVVRAGAARVTLENLWRRALVERAQARAAVGAATRALALQVFVQLARLPAATREETAARRVEAVARAVTETFFERWTLDDAAERAGMSRRHFSAQFRAATGRTFWEYLTEARLEHAAKLLRGGEHSIAGAIFACGFGDVSQFYRLFRARYGCPPGAARGAAV